LLWEEWFDVATILKKKHGLLVSVTTNGTALADGEVLRKAFETFDEIVISLDGAPSFHDRVRGKRGLAALVESVIRDLSARHCRAEYGPRLTINTILMRDNVAEFADLCLSVADWGVDNLTFNPLGGRERPDFFCRHRLTDEDIRAFCTFFSAYSLLGKKAGLRIYGSPSYLEFMTSPQNTVPTRVAPCFGRNLFLSVDEDGFAFPCNTAELGGGIDLTDITSADELARLPHLFSDIMTTTPSGVCRTCRSTQRFGKYV